MIHVRIIRNEHKHIASFEVSGHAESGPYGHDLVCAAVSAVTFGTVNAIMKLLCIEPTIQQGGEGGYLKMDLPTITIPEVLEKAQTLLEGMVVSLETIERDYHQYITIS
ncbi:ribosomal-processing cysteine protease Prp [Salirhabdus sp. Marseille-P4669]|uniref:ribosomal-processing cysteine protease Prp n=1 Tax=Salirhabdus sp. Marseille-P4669 TaxID=2042310 RepID=UPI000C7CD3F6|nr:ribosomal-processing cysteine protease Prp [Salirhabdus sp. Marseille-P4669]